MYPGMVNMSEFPLSIKGKPFIIQKGIPDLVLPTPTGLKVGEIKPANPEGYIEGDAKIEIYKRLAKEAFADKSPAFTVEALDVPPPPPIPFVEPAAIDCPQTLITGPSVRGVYGYLCWPPFKELVAKCKCRKGPEPPPVRRARTEEEKEKERNRRRQQAREAEPAGPSPIPALAAIMVALSISGFALKKFAVRALGKLAGGYAYAIASLLAVTLPARGAEGRRETVVRRRRADRAVLPGA